MIRNHIFSLENDEEQEKEESIFLDALASLDLKLSVSESPFFNASASTGLSDFSFPSSSHFE